MVNDGDVAVGVAGVGDGSKLMGKECGLDVIPLGGGW